MDLEFSEIGVIPKENGTFSEFSESDKSLKHKLVLGPICHLHFDLFWWFFDLFHFRFHSMQTGSYI